MLEYLALGDAPCDTPAGVTVKGLTSLAHYCPHLSEICIHFQVASLDPPGIPDLNEHPIPRKGYTFQSLQLGCIRFPERSALVAALTLLYMFPCTEETDYYGESEGWDNVINAL